TFSIALILHIHSSPLTCLSDLDLSQVWHGKIKKSRKAASGVMANSLVSNFSSGRVRSPLGSP
ncbi:hypothetical protein N8553_03450, partial [bacterium]|nr:hypothetical protein [bacterium]